MNTKRALLSLIIFVGLALTFNIMPSLQDDAPFAINKQGLEKVCKELFTRTKKLIKAASGDAKYSMPPNLDETDIRKVSNYKSIINAIIKRALTKVDVSQALEHPTQDQITALTKQLKRIVASVILEQYTKPADLNWCTCDNAPEYMRIALVVSIVNDARKERDLKKRIVYTSIASGEMLLDYLIISELIHYGFKDIQANFIELGLLDIPDIHAFLWQMDAAAKKQYDLTAAQYSMNTKPLPTGEYEAKWSKLYQLEMHAQNLLDSALDARSYFLAFQRKIKEKAELQNTKVESNHYDHMGDYVARAKKYAFERTDILILVDPSNQIHPLKNSIGAQAFALQFAPESELSPTAENYFDEERESLVLFMPRTSVQDMKLYSNIDFAAIPSDDPLKDMYTKLSQLIYEVKDIAAIRQNANKPFDYISFMINKVAAKFGHDESQEQEKSTLNPFLPAAQEEDVEVVALKIYWISEAYLALQDLVRDCLSDLDSAAVYEIAYPTEKRADPILRRLNAREYQTQDVITPNIGAALEEEAHYKLIEPSPDVRTKKEIKSPAEIADIRSKRAEIKQTKAAANKSSATGESVSKSKKRKKSEIPPSTIAISDTRQTESSSPEVQRVSPVPSGIKAGKEDLPSQEIIDAFLQQIKERNKE